MKSIGCLILLFTLSCFSGFAQISKGTLLLGGVLGFEKNDASDEDLLIMPDNEINLKTFNAGPRAAIFIKNNLAVGLIVNYEHNTFRRWNTYEVAYNERQNQTLAVGPFIRYYLFIQPGLAVFGQASFTYDHDYNQKDGFRFSANLAPGLTYFISSKVGLEMNLGGIMYKHSGFKPSDDYRATSNFLDVRFINGSQIGASFYLSR